MARTVTFSLDKSAEREAKKEVMGVFDLTLVLKMYFVYFFKSDLYNKLFFDFRLNYFVFHLDNILK